MGETPGVVVKKQNKVHCCSTLILLTVVVTEVQDLSSLKLNCN